MKRKTGLSFLKNNKGVVSMFLVCTLVAGSTVPAGNKSTLMQKFFCGTGNVYALGNNLPQFLFDESYEDQIEDAKQRAEDAAEEKQKVQDKLDELAQKKSDTLDYIKQLDAQADDIETQINTLSDEITDMQAKLENTKAELVIARQDEADQYDAMKRRIKYLYENGDTDIFDIFLNSDSLADILNQMEYARKITEYDDELLDKYETARKKVEDEETFESAQLDSLTTSKDQVEFDKDALNKLIKEENAALDKYVAAIKSNKDTLSDYEDELARANEEVNTLKDKKAKRDAAEKARKEKAAAAAKAAKEAAEAAAAELKKQQEEVSDEGSKNGGNDSASDSSGASSSDSGSSDSDTSEKTNVNASGIRAAIAAEAPKHLGLNYVWGGNSLTSGCDCSGFCLAVYRACGLDTSVLDRTSYGMAGQSIGREVSVSEAQPGDLVFYGDAYGNVDHVALYIGNGTIIHESGYEYGCRQSNIHYRTIIKIKDFIDYI